MHPIIAQELAIEEVIAFITPYLSVLPVEHKPTFLHCIRVGMYLYQHGYETDTIIAGFLHDMLEDTDVTYDMIVAKRWTKIADIVLANTRDEALPKSDRKMDLIRRCKQSKEASLIKALDTMDGLRHYILTNNREEIVSKSEYARLLLQEISYEDPLFDELRKLVREIC